MFVFLYQSLERHMAIPNPEYARVLCALSFLAHRALYHRPLIYMHTQGKPRPLIYMHTQGS